MSVDAPADLADLPASATTGPGAITPTPSTTAGGRRRWIDVIGPAIGFVAFIGVWWLAHAWLLENVFDKPSFLIPSPPTVVDRAYLNSGVRGDLLQALGWTALVALSGLLISIVFGVLTTGSGPHSGDAEAGRTGFDSEILEHVHAWPGYALLVLTLVLVVAAWRLRLPTLRWSIALLAIELVQVGVGLYQARNGLPAFAVGVHMVLAALTAAAMTIVIMRLKRPVAADAAPEAGVEPGARAARTTPAG